MSRDGDADDELIGAMREAVLAALLRAGSVPREQRLSAVLEVLASHGLSEGCQAVLFAAISLGKFMEEVGRSQGHGASFRMTDDELKAEGLLSEHVRDLLAVLVRTRVGQNSVAGPIPSEKVADTLKALQSPVQLVKEEGDG